MRAVAIFVALATVLGWSGWIVPAIIVVVLLATSAFRKPLDTVETSATL